MCTSTAAISAMSKSSVLFSSRAQALKTPSQSFCINTEKMLRFVFCLMALRQSPISQPCIVDKYPPHYYTLQYSWAVQEVCFDVTLCLKRLGAPMAGFLNRRGFIKRSLAASAGLTLPAGHNKPALAAGPAGQSNNFDLTRGKIKHVGISRLICGGNLIIGSAHDRDMIYVASLMRHYFTDSKIIETWQLCDEWGINTMIGPVNSPYAFGEDPTIRVYNRYRNERGGQIKWMAQA